MADLGITGDQTGITGDMTGLTGDVTNVSGDVSDVTGDMSGINGDVQAAVFFKVNRCRTFNLYLTIDYFKITIIAA